MAMITCTECGKNFSDRAAACPNCGCPIEFIKADLEKKEAEEKDKIVAKYDILGTVFEVNEKLDRYIRMISSITNYREQFLEDASMCYYNLKSIDGVIEEFPEFLSNILDAMIDTAVEMLKAYGIYEFDKGRFYSKYHSIFDTTQIMEPVVTRYLQILDCKDEIVKYHNLVKQSRNNSWTGGGFGVKGALKGYFKAQMLNVGVSFIHAIPDAQRRANDLGKIEKAKTDLYKDESTRRSIVGALQRVYDAAMAAVFNELTQVRLVADILYDEPKAAAIINNLIQSVNEGNCDKEFARDMCLQAFKENPLYYPTLEIAIQLNLPWFYSLKNEDGLKSFNDYIVDYGFLEIYESREQERLRKKYGKELDEITTLLSVSITSNAALKKVLEKCRTLVDNDLEIDDLIEEAVMDRLKFPVSSRDAEVILALLKDADGYYWCDIELADSIEESIKEVEKDETDVEKVAEIVEDTCLKLSNKKQPKEIIFGNTKDIKTIEHYKAYVESADVPADATIYMMYATWNYTDKCPRKVVMVTDVGLYAHFGDNWEVITKTWKDFAEDKLFKISDGIRTGHDTLEVFYDNDKIFPILSEIRKNLRDYFNMDVLPDVDRDGGLSEEEKGKVRAVCEEYSRKFHAPIHRFGNKKNIQNEMSYYRIAEGLDLPEQIEIYYVYSCSDTDYMKRGLAVADKGLFWKSSADPKRYLAWNEFLDKIISLDGKDSLYIGDEKFYAPSQAGFIVSLLADIQSILGKQNKTESLQAEPENIREKEAYSGADIKAAEELFEGVKTQVRDYSKQMNEGVVKAKSMFSPFLKNARKSFGSFLSGVQNNMETAQEKCPKCGAVISQKGSFCTNCGEKIR